MSSLHRRRQSFDPARVLVVPSSSSSSSSSQTDDARDASSRRRRRRRRRRRHRPQRLIIIVKMYSGNRVSSRTQHHSCVVFKTRHTFWTQKYRLLSLSLSLSLSFQYHNTNTKKRRRRRDPQQKPTKLREQHTPLFFFFDSFFFWETKSFPLCTKAQNKRHTHAQNKTKQKNTHKKDACVTL